ncbi:hypothetical protein GRI97_10245 [Altererythrobacter xixiisoli]|uniref:Lipoprotein n=1 Tax=Croceibacterium xixiisoli TaxID=1476466 RepID=A0A6I4TVY4_9SPHN|nr:hypothetical protein [Croceibacterium xixiisoli]MXO99369.1 hypothetical protein [Croceibacterium xixiisoli]
MRRTVSTLLRQSICIPTAMSLLGCGDVAAPPPYIGATYSGPVRAEIDDSDFPITKWRSGDATAKFEEIAPGRARLILFGTIENEGDASFTVDGDYDDAGFRHIGSSINLSIDAEGTVSGGGVSGNHDYRLSGTLTERALNLAVQYRPTGSAAASTLREIMFRYNLSNEATAKDSKSDKPCRTIRYEMRPVANIGDGTMSMLSVPICLN